MQFNDKNLRLIINDLSFKAYLEDSDVSYETKDQQLPFTPTSFTNDSMAIRVSEKAKFTFNVFSETRDECITNYKSLQNLLKTIKPSYRYVNDQIVPDSSNVTGFVTLQFNGMPLLDRDTVKLHLTSFSYNINKDLGYIHIPTKSLVIGESTVYSDKDMKLIPIAYKISLEGKILLQFEETANFLNSKTFDSVTTQTMQQIDATAKYNTVEKKYNNLIASRDALIDQLKSLGIDVNKPNTIGRQLGALEATNNYNQIITDLNKLQSIITEINNTKVELDKELASATEIINQIK